MTTRTNDCDPARIAGFIAGDMSAAECREFETHLDSCAHCRDELDSQAATPAEWSELRTSLSHLSRESLIATEEESFAPSSRRSLEQDLEVYRKLLGPSDDPRMLGRVGTYEVVGLLGRGGMGVVFKAFDGTLNRYVAIKMLAPLYLASGAAKQRFVREARSAAAVIHENVVGIHAISEWQGIPYLVMTFVPGESLQKRLAQRGTLSMKEVLRIGLQVAQGLAAAHAQGLIHRDIKPANILLETEVDRVKITDFGLARAIDDLRMTGSDIVLGTPEYMSPEQARDEPLDYRTDLFSLGAVLYEACTGRSPFRASTVYGAIRKVIDHTPAPMQELNSELPDWMDSLIEKLLAKDVPSRFTSASDVAATLQQCLAHVEQPRLVELPDSLTSPAARWPRAQTRRIIVTASITFAALATGWVLFAQLLPTSSPPASGNGTTARVASNAPPKDGAPQPAADTDKLVTDPLQDAKLNPLASDATNTPPDGNPEASDQPTATAGNFRIRLRKVDGVARDQKSIKMDPAKMLAKATRQGTSKTSRSSQSSTQQNSSSNGQSNTVASSFSNGVSGGGSVFTSSGSSTSGRPFNPTLGLAFDIEPLQGRVGSPTPGNKSGKEGSSSSAIVEIGENLVATGEQGQPLEHQADSPITMRSLAFEASVPGAFPVYLEETQQVSQLATLKGELLVTPGRALIAEFDGPDKQSQVVDGVPFSIESVNVTPEGVQVATTLPPTTRQKRARTFEEQFKVLTDSMGAFDVTIEDSDGAIYSSIGAGSAGGSASGSSSGGVQINGVPQPGNANANESSHSSQTFNFPPLPPRRSIKTIRIKMTDRTGEPKSYPFTMKDIPVPYPN